MKVCHPQALPRFLIWTRPWSFQRRRFLLALPRTRRQHRWNLPRVSTSPSKYFSSLISSANVCKRAFDPLVLDPSRVRQDLLKTSAKPSNAKQRSTLTTYSARLAFVHLGRLPIRTAQGGLCTNGRYPSAAVSRLPPLPSLRQTRRQQRRSSGELMSLSRECKSEWIAHV